MASLGELTSGIAHEIQNSLNFVNNFSKISLVLLDELKEEIKADHKTDSVQIADDLVRNLSRISHHGQRADSIVKSMLQLSHGTTSTDKKQLTNLNDLANEYLQIAHKDILSRNKNVSVKLAVTLDPAIEQVKVVPQDIGRVLINIFDNAYYAIKQKQEQLKTDYEPILSVCTQANVTDQMVLVVKTRFTTY